MKLSYLIICDWVSWCPHLCAHTVVGGCSTTAARRTWSAAGEYREPSASIGPVAAPGLCDCGVYTASAGNTFTSLHENFFCS